jgi:hypothetical protein
MTSSKDDRKRSRAAGELALQIQTTQTGHLHVKHETRWAVRRWRREKRLRRIEWNRLQPDGTHEPRKKIAERIIIIDHDYHGRFFRHCIS